MATQLISYAIKNRTHGLRKFSRADAVLSMPADSFADHPMHAPALRGSGGRCPVPLACAVSHAGFTLCICASDTRMDAAWAR